jgi:MFS family permease
MAVCLALNHGVVNALLALATAQLGNVLGGYSSGMMYISYSLISLTIATSIVGRVGPKWSLVSALILYCVYTATFIVDIMVPSIRWPMSMCGATIGGFGAGWLWTAQGVYTAAFAREYAAKQQLDVHQVTARLSGIFATIYLGGEVMMKLASSFLLNFMNKAMLFTILSVVAAVSASGMVMIKPLKNPDAQSGDRPTIKKITAALELLFYNRKMQLLAASNVSFGFLAAFLQYYVNGTIVPLNLGFNSVGYFAAVATGAATLMSMPLAWMGDMKLNCGCMRRCRPRAPRARSGSGSTYGSINDEAASAEQLNGLREKLIVGEGEHTAKTVEGIHDDACTMTNAQTAVMVLGGCCFMIESAIVWSQPDSVLSSPAWLVAIYLAHGTGRSVWEGCNKAITMNLFPNEVGTAFANLILQSGIASTVALFGFPSMTKAQMCTICGLSGLMQVICILMLKWELEKERADPAYAARSAAASMASRAGSMASRGGSMAGGRPKAASTASHTGSIIDEGGDEFDEQQVYTAQADEAVAAALAMMGSFNEEEGGERLTGNNRGRQSSMFTSLATNSKLSKTLQ